MKILRVIHSMDPVNGGPCQGLRNMIPELGKLGCRNEVVCLDDPDAAFLGDDPFPIHALGKGRGPFRYHPGLVPWLRANIGRFDALIVHGLWLWQGLATWLAAKSPLRSASHLAPSTLPPYFVMPHGMLDPWFQRDRTRRWKALRNTVYWHLIERRLIGDAEAVLFTSARERELARDTFHGYRPKVEVTIGYGVPEPPPPSESVRDAFRSCCPTIPEGKPFLLFLGRIDPKKGVDLLIGSYASVYGGDAGCPPHLVIAGPLDSEYAREMIGYASSLLPGAVHLRDSASTSGSAKGPGIHFTGMIQGEAKWGALHGCEALILPSHQENFGIAVVESLGCGRPVLISDKVNIHDVVTYAGAGLVSTDDLGGVRELLDGWMNLSPGCRAVMSEAAERIFISQYGAPEAAARFVSTLSPLIRP